jgi:ribose 5-phosphate isomerase B
MRIALAADELTGVAGLLAGEVLRRGHEPILHGALAEQERREWAWATERAARDVADGRAEQAVVCCWTGTGASIAANKVAGVRAALCADAVTAEGARRWNDANVLALSLRTTSEALLVEILDAWFAGRPSELAEDQASVDHLPMIERTRKFDVVAELSVQGGRAAIDFYRDAFGAVEVHRVGGTDEQQAVVCQLAVGPASFWVSDESPEQGLLSPRKLGGATTRLLLIVEDPASVFARAVSLGARELSPVGEEHGWLLGKIEDPFGHQWEIGRPVGSWPPIPGPASLPSRAGATLPSRAAATVTWPPND